MREILARRRALLWQAFSMRTRALAPILAAAVAAGCFQSTTLIRINADGSGTIEQTTLVTDAAMRQLRQFAAMGAESGKPQDLFSTAQARQMAAAIGADVSTLSSTRIKTAEGEGSKATFGFADINRLRFKQGGASSDDAADAAYARSPGTPQVHFSLTHQPDGHAVLRITMPAAQMPSRTTSTAPAGSGSRPQNRVPPD